MMKQKTHVPAQAKIHQQLQKKSVKPLGLCFDVDVRIDISSGSLALIRTEMTGNAKPGGLHSKKIIKHFSREEDEEPLQPIRAKVPVCVFEDAQPQTETILWHLLHDSEKMILIFLCMKKETITGNNWCSKML